jgi:hypothetical protein
MDNSHSLKKNPPHLYQYSFGLSYGYTLLGFRHEVCKIVHSKPWLQSP